MRGWSEDRIEALKAMRKQGLSLAAISETFNMGKTAIAVVARRLGLNRVGPSGCWTESRVEELRKRWAGGESCSQIAYALGDGVTRNAVIGKVTRLGLAHRLTKQRSTSRSYQWAGETKPARPRQPAKRVKKSVVPEFGTEPFLEQPMTIEAAVPHVDFAALEANHCRFPYGDPRASDFHYCGHAKSGSLPYCEGHARIAYQSIAPRMRSGELERELAKAG